MDYTDSPDGQAELERIERDDCLCRYCGNLADQAHHRNYRSKTMSGRLIVDILSICGDCHRFISVECGRVCSMEKMKRKTLELVKIALSARSSKAESRSTKARELDGVSE